MPSYRRKRKPRGFGLLLAFCLLAVLSLAYQSKPISVHYSLISRSDSRILFEMVEGVMIFALVILCIRFLIKAAKRRSTRQQFRNSRIYEIDRMSGKQFEQFLTVYFEDMGYRVENKGGTGDRGCDLILKGKGKTIIVQAKRYGKVENGKFIGGHVPFEAIQQAHTAKDLFHCQEAWVVTNNKGFTKQARETAQQLGIELWDRKKLIAYMAAYHKKKRVI